MMHRDKRLFKNEKKTKGQQNAEDFSTLHSISRATLYTWLKQETEIRKRVHSNGGATKKHDPGLTWRIKHGIMAFSSLQSSRD
jgi:hypothetical protein